MKKRDELQKLIREKIGDYILPSSMCDEDDIDSLSEDILDLIYE